jgi:hypothetical protein
MSDEKDTGKPDGDDEPITAGPWSRRAAFVIQLQWTEESSGWNRATPREGLRDGWGSRSLQARPRVEWVRGHDRVDASVRSAIDVKNLRALLEMARALRAASSSRCRRDRRAQPPASTRRTAWCTPPQEQALGHR